MKYYVYRRILSAVAGLKLGHAPANLARLSSGFVTHCSLCFAKQIPSEVGLLQEDFSDEKSVLAVLSFKHRLHSLSASTDGLRLPHI